MIEAILAAIVEALGEIEGVPTLGTWEGDVDEIVARPQRLPALQVCYDGADFGEKATIGANQADITQEFTVVAIARSLRTRAEGAASCHALVEAVRTALIGLKVEGYGHLWPVREDLVLAEGGVIAYGCTYKIVSRWGA